MKRTYLIDSENINDIWVELLQGLEEKDEILVFYTEKSAHMGYDRIIRLMELRRGVVTWLRCFEGQNALDFQLVTELGSRISQEPKREYIIVSNDTGYDAVVRYWQQKEYRVRRMKGIECEALVGMEKETVAEMPHTDMNRSGERMIQATEDAHLAEEVHPHADAEQPKNETASQKPKSEQPKAESPAAEPAVEPAAKPETKPGLENVNTWQEEISSIFRESGSADAQTDMKFLLELCKTVKLSNMSLLHNVLEYHFGQEAGNAVYRFIKENPGCRGELSAGYSNNKKQRERQYLSLILERNHIIPEEGDEEAILKILGGIPRKNLNSIHTALIKKFGQEEGSNCYAVLRNHVKIIREL